jgi:hypothetical protein
MKKIAVLVAAVLLAGPASSQEVDCKKQPTMTSVLAASADCTNWLMSCGVTRLVNSTRVKAPHFEQTYAMAAETAFNLGPILCDKFNATFGKSVLEAYRLKNPTIHSTRFWYGDDNKQEP